MTPTTSSPVRAELEAVRRKIEAGWTQHVSARDAHGDEIDPRSDEAVCWCSMGARAAVGISLRDYRNLLGFDVGEAPIWNDAESRTQAEVLARLDAALAREANAPELRHV